MPENAAPSPKKDVGAGSISIEFKGNVNFNGFGTTLVIGGVTILLWILVTGLFFSGSLMGKG